MPAHRWHTNVVTRRFPELSKRGLPNVQLVRKHSPRRYCRGPLRGIHKRSKYYWKVSSLWLDCGRVVLLQATVFCTGLAPPLQTTTRLRTFEVQCRASPVHVHNRDRHLHRCVSHFRGALRTSDVSLRRNFASASSDAHPEQRLCTSNMCGTSSVHSVPQDRLSRILCGPY